MKENFSNNVSPIKKGLSNKENKKGKQIAPTKIKKPFKPRNDILHKIEMNCADPHKSRFDQLNFAQLPTDIYYRIALFLTPAEILTQLKPLSVYWWRFSESKMLWNYYHRRISIPQSYQYLKQNCIVERRSKGKLYVVKSRLNHEKYIQRIIDTKLSNANSDDGIPPSILREISYLRALPPHPSLNQILDIEMNAHYVSLIYEYHPQSLKDLLKQKAPLNVPKIIYQIATALHHLHSNGILHRNIKPENVLITETFTIKLTDFGLARKMIQPIIPYTPEDPKDRERSGRESKRLWYRAPELLLRSQIYSSEIDVWSFGCLFAELALNEPLFTGESEIEQLFQTFRLIGSPSEEDWKEIAPEDFRLKLPQWKAYPLNFSKIEDFMSYQEDMFDNRQASFAKIKRLNSALGEDGMELLEWCLDVHSQKRPTLAQILEHGYFSEVHGRISPKREEEPLEFRQYLPEFQSNITPLMRGILIDWLIDVANHFELQDETLQLAITYTDLALSRKQIEKNKLQLFGVTAIKMADVYNERSKEYYKQDNCQEYAYITADEYSPQELIATEKVILTILDYKLTYKTAMHHIKEIAVSHALDQHVVLTAKYFADFFLQFHQHLPIKRELLAWTCIYLGYHFSEAVCPPIKAAPFSFTQFFDTLVQLRKIQQEWKNNPQMHAFEAVHQKYSTLPTRSYLIPQLNQSTLQLFYNQICV